MPKQKSSKSFSKRVKLTSTGKILRRHQLGSGHLKRHKSKTAINRQKKTSTYFLGATRGLKKILGL